MDPESGNTMKDIIIMATHREIVRAVAEGYGIHPKLIYNDDRKPHYVMRARYAAIRALSIMKPNMSFSQIGNLINRHHSTVLYALDRLKRHPDF